MKSTYYYVYLISITLRTMNKTLYFNNIAGSPVKLSQANRSQRFSLGFSFGGRLKILIYDRTN